MADALVVIEPSTILLQKNTVTVYTGTPSRKGKVIRLAQNLILLANRRPIAFRFALMELFLFVNSQLVYYLFALILFKKKIDPENALFGK